MQIVDAQIHIWGQGLPSNAAHIQTTSFTAAEAIAMMDQAGVDAAVIHPPSWDPNSTELAFQAVQDYPGRFAIMADLDLDDLASRDRLVTWRDQPGMLGLRYLFLDDQTRRLTDGSLDWLWAGAQEHGIPIAMLATGSEAVIGQIAERHPGLRLTIDHLGGRGGNTTLKDHAAMAHMPDLLALARHPNIAVKVTGAPGYSAQEYPFPIMSDYMRQIFDAFGPKRTFWGTDITKMPCTWTQCITQFTEEMPWLNREDLEWVMGKAVRDWWEWR
ncbi:MAG: amidohydrolase family protein [Pseudomonadota bacterium]